MEIPEIKALNTSPSKLLVMLHGVGSDGNDLISLVPFIQKSLPDYHFISPDGVEAYDMAPFGRQWFSLQDRSPVVILKLVEQNAPPTLEIIKKKQKELGLSNAQTILLGFSQGTMMGIYLTLSQTEPFAGFVGFSGRLIAPPIPTNKSTPICIIHGQDDEVVYAKESEKMAEYCKQHNISQQLLLIPNLQHSIDASGMEFALNFIRGIK